MCVSFMMKNAESEKKKSGDGMKKNILVVDDSALMRRVMCDIINSDQNFQATDYCRDGLEAYERLKRKSYDGVVLDLNMPKMNGLQLLECLQRDGIKVKVIVVSAPESCEDADATIHAMQRGADDFVSKPGNIKEAKSEDFKKRLLLTLNTVCRISPASKVKRTHKGTTKPETVQMPVKRIKASGGRNRLVAIACSTGGPKALQSVIPYLPKNLDAPVVLVQHMPVGFTRSMAQRLDELSQVEVTEAEDGDLLKKGHVYVAPGGSHMLVTRNTDGTHRIVLDSSTPAIGGLKPCANLTYDSLAKSGFDEIICVVLTGMGSDGTNGILSLGRSKPIHVIAQDEKSCVVYGMPKSIADSGIVDEIVPLKEVAKSITKKAGVK